MDRYPELTREIDAGPSGSHVGAFFDLDRTLIAGFSAFSFIRDGFRSGRLGGGALLELALAGASFQLGTIGFSGFMAGTARTMRGMTEADLAAIGENLFDQAIAAEIYPEARAIVEAHRRKGHTLAVISSATPYQVGPVARELGIDHVLATEFEVDENGFLTGDVMHPTCYGEGKAIAARSLAKEHALFLGESWFYTDSDEDLPLLEIVGRPRPTNPNRDLARIAARRDWPAQHFSSRGLPSVGEVARTGLAMASLVPAFLVGLPAAWLNDDWQRTINIAISTWGELATMLARVEVRVSGEENLWSKRPAVFVFNHQSGLDMLLICKLLRRDFVGISKVENRNNPFFGPFLELAGTVFIDRADSAKAIEALEPAVDALRRGLSLAIAPEGTRSATPQVGAFKKGAFRMAMRAGVPIVPVVLKNTLDALPRDWFVVRPTTIEVEVHPPIDTADWTHDDLDDRIEEVRQVFVEAIGTD